MRSKLLKYLIITVLIVFVGFKSVYIKKLDEVTRATPAAGFVASSYAQKLFRERLLPLADSALDLNVLISLLRTDPEKAFKEYSHALAIGNIRYFLVGGEGTILRIDESNTVVELKDGKDKTPIQIATEFIYGNAVRDASGLVSLSDFSNTTEVNKVAEEINTIIRKEVLPPFAAKAKTGSAVKFTGAIELNQKYIVLDSIEVIPIRLTVLE